MKKVFLLFFIVYYLNGAMGGNVSLIPLNGLPDIYIQGNTNTGMSGGGNWTSYNYPCLTDGSLDNCDTPYGQNHYVYDNYSNYNNLTGHSVTISFYTRYYTNDYSNNMIFLKNQSSGLVPPNIWENVGQASNSGWRNYTLPNITNYLPISVAGTSSPWSPCCGIYIAEITVIVSNTLPTVPSLTSHSNYHNSASTTVSWSASTDADNDAITYDVKVGTTSGGTDVLNYQGDTDTTSNSFTMTPQATYYWSVRSYDGYEYSNWATESSFTFTNSAPTIPQISFPSNNSRQYNNTINYTWNVSTDSDSDALTYDFWLSNQSNFGYTINRTNFTNNWTGNITTTNGITYYGKVRSNDSYTYSSWSPTIQFTENTAPSVVNITLLPVNPSVTSNLTISMNGSDAEGDSLTKYYRWYKNGVLNNSWNDSTYVNYTNNFTTGDSIYVRGFIGDSYENSSELQSNQVIIGSTNSAPTLSALTLIPSTKKNNQTININASGITDDSTSWQLQTYYKNGSTNVYISNSSWGSESSINITATIPFTTGGAHIIYAIIYDSGNVTGQSNLTSSELQQTFTSLTTDPTIESSSLSASSITVGNTVTITAQFNGQGANISSATVNVERPDATIANWTMTCDSGEIVNCTKSYTSTSDIGIYYIRYFYPTDTANITATISSVLTFTASAVVTSSGGGGGGGGGGGVVYIAPTPSMTSSLNLSIIGITDGARSVSDVEAINRCLTDSFFLSNECTSSAVIALKSQTNWYTMFGAYLASLFTIFGLNLIIKKKRSYFDAGIYGTIVIISALAMNLVGFNFVFLWNYVLNNSLSAFTFFSFMTWGFVGTVLLDELVFKKPVIHTIRRLDI